MANEVSYLKIKNTNKDVRYTIDDLDAIKNLTLNFTKNGEDIVGFNFKAEKGPNANNIFNIDIDELFNDKLFQYANYYDVEISIEDNEEEILNKINTKLIEQTKPAIVFCYHIDNDNKIYDAVYLRTFQEGNTEPIIEKIFINIYPEDFPENNEEINDYFNDIFNYQTMEQLIRDFEKIPYYREYIKTGETITEQVTNYKRYYYTSENYVELREFTNIIKIRYHDGKSTGGVEITEENITNLKKMLI